MKNAMIVWFWTNTILLFRGGGYYHGPRPAECLSMADKRHNGSSKSRRGSTTVTAGSVGGQEEGAIAAVTGLFRYAVKGLSGDALTSVVIAEKGETFPDDRRYALLRETKRHMWQPLLSSSSRSTDDNQEQEQDLPRLAYPWIHKENFLCAFTAPELLATIQSTYSIKRRIIRQALSSQTQQESSSFGEYEESTSEKTSFSGFEFSRGIPCDTINDGSSLVGSDPDTTMDGSTRGIQRILTLKDRFAGKSLLDRALDLQYPNDRELLADYLSKRTNQKVICITKVEGGKDTTNSDEHHSSEQQQQQQQQQQDTQQHHTHQFGNTSSGYKQRNDTRTVHIINQATVRDLSRKIGIDLNPSRFRPNIIIDTATLQQESQASQKSTIRSTPRSSNNDASSTVETTCDFSDRQAEECVGAWSEFDWIGKTLVEPNSKLQLTVISKTVRCKGVSVDPLRLQKYPLLPSSNTNETVPSSDSVGTGDSNNLDEVQVEDTERDRINENSNDYNDENEILDIPNLLIEHFPEHGPYLGVYAVIDHPGTISIGDRFEFLNEK